MSYTLPKPSVFLDRKVMGATWKQGYYTAEQMQAAYEAGRASRDAEVEALKADAARYQWLKENCAYHYSMQPDSPAEHGIEYQWQQGTYEERNQGLDGSIDQAIDAARKEK